MTGDLDWELLSAVFACFFASVLGLVTLFNYFAENLDTTAAAGPTVLDPRLSMAKLALYFAAGLVVGVVLAVQLDMPLVGVLVFLGAGVMGVFHQKKAQNELRYALDDALPTVLTRWSNDMASGISFDRAVEASFIDCKPAIRPVLSAILPQLAEDPAIAFQAALRRMEDKGTSTEAFAMVVAVVATGSRAGKLGPALASLSEKLQEIENLKLILRKETESGRRNVMIMVVAGAVIAVLMNVVTPSTLQDVPPTPQSELVFIASLMCFFVAYVAGYLFSRTKV